MVGVSELENNDYVAFRILCRDLKQQGDKKSLGDPYDSVNRAE